jgi:aryl-alcohol dehydrogenase-like predicted oxidoreductase
LEIYSVLLTIILEKLNFKLYQGCERIGRAMEYRTLGRSGFKVPVLSFGTATFAGKGELFKAFGETEVKEATKMIDICLDHGVNFFDSADIYSHGASEEVLGAAIKGRRDQLLISTKSTFRLSEKDPNDVGSSRFHLINACEASLKRLGTDHIDLYQMHAFDAITPIEETLRALENLIQSGKVRYIGCSNFSGWHLMKSLSISEKFGWERYIAYQGYYSLVGRDYETELMPLAIDQGIGLLVWSPLGWGRLTGKINRKNPKPPAVSRLHKTAEAGPPIENEYLLKIVDVLEEISHETGKTIPQISINWLLQRPTVSTVILGARNAEQLKDNLGSIGWYLTQNQMERLDKASDKPLPYPYWHQKNTFEERNPSILNYRK